MDVQQCSHASAGQWDSYCLKPDWDCEPCTFGQQNNFLLVFECAWVEDQASSGGIFFWPRVASYEYSASCNKILKLMGNIRESMPLIWDNFKRENNIASKSVPNAANKITIKTNHQEDNQI